MILNDFLSLGKLEEGKVDVNLETFDLENFLNEILEEVNCFLKTGQKVAIKLHANLQTIKSDSRILRNILFNLISNASKYSDQGKLITIECEEKHSGILFHVKDEGRGIPKEEQKHLFDRFFRASNAGDVQGTGLGLNIVKRYVDLLSGEISFTSEYGKGTTFHIYMPNKSGRKRKH